MLTCHLKSSSLFFLLLLCLHVFALAAAWMVLPHGWAMWGGSVMVLGSFLWVWWRCFWYQGGKKVLALGVGASCWVTTSAGEFAVLLHPKSVITRYVMILTFQRSALHPALDPVFIFPDTLTCQERQVLCRCISNVAGERQ
jgi:hypothetical protein